MGLHGWIFLIVVFIIICSLLTIKIIKENIFIVKVINNFKFHYKGTNYILITEDQYDELILKQGILNTYINSWMSGMKYNSLTERPAWLVNDFAAIIYKILCSDETPEDSSWHWEGWIANRLGIMHEKLISEALNRKKIYDK